MSKKIEKVVEEFNYFIIFVDSNNHIQHSVGYADLPLVSDLKYLFEELKTDKDFAIPNVDDLRVDIICKKEWLSIFGEETK